MATIKKHTVSKQRRGDTFDGIQFTINVNAAPLDLTNVGIRAWFRRGNVNGPVSKKIEKSNGITVVDAANGICKIDPFKIIFSEDHVCDVEFDMGGNRYKTYIELKFPIELDITT